ncbi:OmpA family protein [Pseudooceanicola nitratireducens]
MRAYAGAWLGVGLAACVLPGTGLAFDPVSLPEAARRTFDDTAATASIRIPVARLGEAGMLKEVEGSLRRRAWAIPSPTLPTLRVLQGLRQDMEDAGYQVVLDCASEACGGFDFRFALPVLPAPEMNVDIFDYRVLVGRKGDAGREEHVYVLVSKGRANRFVQIYEVARRDAAPPSTLAPPSAEPTLAAPATPSPADPGDTDLISRLKTRGHVVLRDLDFASGAGALSEKDYPSLAALAAYLSEKPERRVVLVGHTDAVGSLASNTALSQTRADSVRDQLVSVFGVTGSQITARGVGYLSPIATNLTPEGRDMNRRVEVVLLVD